jgi:Ca2+-binding EF-hand superfamily protein
MQVEESKNLVANHDPGMNNLTSAGAAILTENLYASLQNPMSQPMISQTIYKDHKIEDDDNLEEISDDKTKSDILVHRMKKIERLMKEKFSNNWTSIRKAFLDIDMDYDGFITAEDIARQFTKDNQKLDFRDLRTLIKNRDSKRKGKIDFKDFCKWMGEAIQPSETFYFRHDSLRNPQYEDNLFKQDQNNGDNKKKVSDKIMNSNLMKRILDKIQTQWKTLKKAFSDLNQGKNGWISEVDLKKYLDNWGFNITEGQFKEFYEFLDYDRDGHITYEDFKKSVGSVISPVEFLYFRQDDPPPKQVT